MGVVGFVVILVALLAILHLYLWLRLVRGPLGPGRSRRVAGFGLLAGLLLVLVAVLAEPVLPARYAGWLAGPGYVWLGVVFYLLVGLLVLELPVLAVRLVLRWRASSRARVPAADLADPAHPVDPAVAPTDPADRAADPVDPAADPAADPVDAGRRRLLRRAAAVAAGVAALGISGYGVQRAYAPPRVTRLVVPLSRLDPRADGLRVAVIADLHLGPLYGARQVERVVDTVNALEPDLVALVGDLASSEAGRVREAAAPLRAMRSRYGAFFVTGNHEYYQGLEEWLEAAGDLGLRVLRNQRVEIAHRGGAIDLAGVNDREGSNYDDPPDYAAALGDRDPSRPVLLLAHQPVQVHRAAAYGVDLQLSGHTHGGQIYPFDLLVRLDQPTVSGLAEIDGTLVYVTDGAGFWGPPMRVGADPEVTLLELRVR